MAKSEAIKKIKCMAVKKTILKKLSAIRAKVRVNKTFKKPASKKQFNIRKKPAGVFMWPMPPKKGKHLLYRRPAGHRSNTTYTKVRPMRYVQKRNLKRPAASAFLNPSIMPRQFRISCRKFGLLPRRRACHKRGGLLNTGKLVVELNMNGYRRKRKGCQAHLANPWSSHLSDRPKGYSSGPAVHNPQGIPQWNIGEFNTPSTQPRALHD